MFVFATPVSATTETSAGIKPGSFFYFFDTTSEKISLFFTFGSENKAKKALKYADERLAEAKESANKNNPKAVEKAMTGYKKEILFATEKSKGLKDQNRAEELLNIVSENTAKHQETLASVLEKVPEEAKQAILNAIEVSKKGQEEAVKQITELKGEIEKLKKEVAELKAKNETQTKDTGDKNIYTPPAPTTQKQTPTPTPQTTPSPATVSAPSTCTANWQCNTWNTCTNSQQTRVCTDLNSCGISTRKPNIVQSCTSICTPNWQTGSWTTCANNQQTRTAVDLNNCGTTTGKPTRTQSCTTPVEETYIYHDYYPIILSLSDNYGTVIKTSGYNDYRGSFLGPWITRTLRIGDKIHIKIEASDPKSRPILYLWDSNNKHFKQEFNDNMQNWTSNNEISYTITEETFEGNGELLRIVANIKSEKENFRNTSKVNDPKDDLIFIDYNIAIPTPPTPLCQADTWLCNDWDSCSASGSQTRSCSKTFECLSVVTPSPSTSQACTPPAPSYVMPDKPIIESFCDDKGNCACSSFAESNSNCSASPKTTIHVGETLNFTIKVSGEETSGVLAFILPQEYDWVKEGGIKPWSTDLTYTKTFSTEDVSALYLIYAYIKSSNDNYHRRSSGCNWTSYSCDDNVQLMYIVLP